MILEWRDELQKTANFELDKATEYWAKKFNPYTAINPEAAFGKLVKKFGIIEVMDCIDIAFNQYFRHDIDSADIALNMLGGILHNRANK